MEAGVTLQKKTDIITAVAASVVTDVEKRVTNGKEISEENG